MSIIHLVVGDLTAQPLFTAINEETAPGEEIVVLKDILHVGPLRTDGIGFSEGRSAFWQTVSGEPSTPVVTDDLERLMQVSSRLSNSADIKIWFWMAPTPADVVAYFWLLHFLKKHQGRFYVVNINGLPFLDNNGKLFYPESIGHIPVKEVTKARKLARATLPSEWETDGDEWGRLLEEHSGIRIFEGGKRLKGAAIDHYDDLLLAAISAQPQKISKVINLVMSKHKVPTGDLFLQWRLKTMAEAGIIDLTKHDVKLGKGPEQDQPEETDPTGA